MYALLAVAALCSAPFVSAQDFKPGAYPPLEVGNPAAEFKIEIFNDFQCPASAAFFKQFKELVAKHPDRVLVIFRNFPLRQHKNSLLAAKAVEAAAQQGKFLEMMTMIYDNQEALKDVAPSPEVFAGYAKAIGLDVDRFTADVDGQTAIDRINFDIERAKLLGVNGTPWVLLNDRPMAYGDAQNMEATIFGNN
jgi:protein-disulfide isomerase